MCVCVCVCVCVYVSVRACVCVCICNTVRPRTWSSLVKYTSGKKDYTQPHNLVVVQFVVGPSPHFIFCPVGKLISSSYLIAVLSTRLGVIRDPWVLTSISLLQLSQHY